MQFGITRKVAVLAALLVLGTAASVGFIVLPLWMGHATPRMALWHLVLATLAFLPLAIGVAVVLARLLVRPLRVIAAAAAELADGRDVEHDLPVARLDEIGAVARAFATMSARIRQRSAELEASRQRVQDILESAPDAMVAFTPDGRIVLANEPARRLFGYSTVELVGSSVNLLVPGRMQAGNAQQVPHVFAAMSRAGPAGRRFELYFQRKDGGEFLAEVSLSPTAAVNEALTISAIRDITARKQQEHALVQAREEALEASRAKSQFLARMSHEIRTPLHAMLGTGELLQRTALSATQRKHVRRLQQAGDALLAVINDILDLSKIEAGRLVLHAAPFAVVPFLERVAEFMAVSAHAKGLDVDLDLPDELPLRLLGDEDRLSQVLVNLLGNAIKFTDAGSVCLRARQEVGVGVDPGLHLSVSDSGIGIAPGNLERIFESFTQADSSLTRARPGAGLGLSISRHLVTRMGGRIWAESRRGRGSTFHVMLPLPVVEGPPPAPAPVLAGCRVLVAVANPAGQAPLIAALTARGAVCGGVADGDGVLGALADAAHAPHVLVVDVRLPAVHGAGWVGDVRRLAPALRVVVLVDGRTEDAGPWSADGGVLLLQKPVRRDELAGVVRDAWQRVPESIADLSPGVEQAPPLRVLVAEDSVDNQEIVRGFLAGMPYELEVAADGRAAVEACRRGDVDIVLMDIQMPVLDGYGAIREIREWEVVRGLEPVPIIALTAHALEDERARSVAAGADIHLAKPMRRGELLAAMRRLTTREGARTAAAESCDDIDPALRARLPQYLERRRDDLARLRAACAAGDFATVQMLGHRLKGHAGSYGLDELGTVGSELERAGAQADSATLPLLLDQLEHLLAATPTT